MKAYVICVLYLFCCFILGCKTDIPSSSEVNNQTGQPWAILAKGYWVEDAWPVFGDSTCVRISETSTNTQSYDFTLKVGPVSSWTEGKSKTTYFKGWGERPTNEDDLHSLQSARHVIELSLSLEGKAVFFPEQSFVDLIDLRVDRDRSFLMKKDGVIFLYLEGGDAGEGYKVKFTILSGKLVKREVWAGEFPELGPEVIIF